MVIQLSVTISSIDDFVWAGVVIEEEKNPVGGVRETCVKYVH